MGRRGLLACIAVGVLAAAAVVFFLLRDDQPAAAGEIFLEPAAAAVPDAFTPSVARAAPPGSRLGPDPLAGVSSSGTARTAGGNTPGLYGGTQDLVTCDSDQLVGFLETNPDKAQAWARVLGVGASEIAGYVDGLTPVLLRADTRVTNHGFAGGRAIPRQAVLQAGTAVLIDRFGVPRVKCYCGNPLLEPVAVQATPVYTGVGWASFSPQLLVVVQPTVIIENFVLYNVVNGRRIVRPVPIVEPVGPEPPSETETLPDPATATDESELPSETASQAPSETPSPSESSSGSPSSPSEPESSGGGGSAGQPGSEQAG